MLTAEMVLSLETASWVLMGVGIAASVTWALVSGAEPHVAVVPMQGGAFVSVGAELRLHLQRTDRLTDGAGSDQMTLAYRPVNGQLALAIVGNSAPGTPRTIPRGTLVPVDIVDVALVGWWAGGLVGWWAGGLVGWGRGNISIIDGGNPFVADGQDVFIARLDQNRDVTESDAPL